MQQQAKGLLLFLLLVSLHIIFVFINTIKKGKNMSEKYKKVYKNGNLVVDNKVVVYDK